MSNAINILINLLARREYSEFELRLKLASKNFGADEIDQAISYVRTKNWQSDLRFAENYIRYRANKGFSKNKILFELKHKGLTDSTIKQAIISLDIDWTEIAKTAIHKKISTYSSIDDIDLPTKQKIWRFMLSRGFYPEEFAKYLAINT